MSLTMKAMCTIAHFLLGATLILAFTDNTEDRNKINGAWNLKIPAGEITLIAQDDYITFTAYDLAAKNFHYSWGGNLNEADGKLMLEVEFSSNDTSAVGTKLSGTYTVTGNELTLDMAGKKDRWKRVDDNSTQLTGCWRINRRLNDGKMSELKPGPRRTLKILSGTRFQWMAINVQTKQFSGTGGGTYTFENGKYTEHIEFFSRDSSRVGATLNFDGKVENGLWHHSGLSSRGEPVKETWVRYRVARDTTTPQDASNKDENALRRKQ